MEKRDMCGILGFVYIYIYYTSVRLPKESKKMQNGGLKLKREKK